MTAISISDASLEAVKGIKRELDLVAKKDISLRELEDKICEYILTRKADFITTHFGADIWSKFSAERREEGKEMRKGKAKGGKR